MGAMAEGVTVELYHARSLLTQFLLGVQNGDTIAVNELGG